MLVLSGCGRAVPAQDTNAKGYRAEVADTMDTAKEASNIPDTTTEAANTPNTAVEGAAPGTQATPAAV